MTTMRKITNKHIEQFQKYLIETEKSKATVERYLHDIKSFFDYTGCKFIEKSTVLAYKFMLTERYSVASVNSILSSLNSFFNYMEWYELRVKTIKVQKQIFASTEKELTKAEYERHVSTLALTV